MAITLSVPPGIVSHVRGIQIVAQQPATRAIRQAVIDHFEAERSQYPTVKAFAVAESARLARQGVQYPAGAIRVLLHRAQSQPRKVTRDEQVLAQFRMKNPRTEGYWHDPGDFAMFPRTSRLRTIIARLRQRGFDIRRRPASWETKRTRGWQFEYRLYEAQ